MSTVRVCAITCDCYPEDPLVRRTAEAAARAAGIEYHVLCSQKEGQSEYEVFNGVHVHRIALRSSQGKPLGRITGKPLGTTLWLWSRFAISAFRRVARLHSRLKFDVVHVHNLPDFLVFSALVPKLAGARIILGVQDVTPELMAVKSKGLFRRVTVPLAKLQERVSTAFADHVLTVGWPFEESLMKRGVPRAKLSSVLNSADPNLFPAEKRTDPFVGEPTAARPLTVMYYGTCAERCGLDTAIRAIAQALPAAPHLRLHLMVRGESRAWLQQLAQELGVSDHVLFSPTVPVDQVADFVERGDISIIPYRADGFMDLVLPTKAYECALMRRPMIASDTVAMRSMFRPVSVKFCAPASVDDFAAAILDLYRHPEQRAQLAANAEQDYARFSWEEMAEQYRKLLVSLASRNGAGAPHAHQAAA